MNGNRKDWLVGLAVFAGGVISGLLLAPRSGRELRRSIASPLADGLSGSARWVGSRYHDLERQLAALEHQLAATTAEFSERLVQASHHVVDYYVPAVPEDPEAWSVDDQELMRDLRFLPRC